MENIQEIVKEIFDAALRDEYSEWHSIDWKAVQAFVGNPDGHPKLPHLWPVKLLQAGRPRIMTIPG